MYLAIHMLVPLTVGGKQNAKKKFSNRVTDSVYHIISGINSG